jgi:rhodanese-related sulfurtransferase
MSQNETSTKAHEWVAQGALLLDVRTPAEFQQGHLDGARNIPVQELPQRVKELGAPSQKVVVYCAAGGRSATAADILRRAGFTECVNLGPMSAWSRYFFFRKARWQLQRHSPEPMQP